LSLLLRLDWCIRVIQDSSIIHSTFTYLIYEKEQSWRYKFLFNGRQQSFMSSLYSKPQFTVYHRFSLSIELVSIPQVEILLKSPGLNIIHACILLCIIEPDNQLYTVHFVLYICSGIYFLVTFAIHSKRMIDRVSFSSINIKFNAPFSGLHQHRYIKGSLINLSALSVSVIAHIFQNI